ncbi:carbohydrate kinase [Mesorhizobium sp. M4B.F.Ca.ET.215.01.1.1]|uniref:FGGY-family carbohydrate kinase n=1 Tax=unclassified Mesorhizobium TaxID=325217 RepID=UPI000FC9BB35|nr:MULTISPECIES: FGGY-family carbohydrate kinase [unclassified Mesorhizobium]RUW28299.1 carbohydrate kinase [Mesorhizobium sp. M4B.F.Ca.ET.013.02.1.1]RVD38369.1 carbohydrate kinase [Mesorhizobium sp. M4B.F.Ca.ET.019.03.1.1]RWF64530.1 MAG: carbohydrate kinase [Mesorhizobium sp.]TGQ10704.1 carbohydrate kinase [Mesorhizobium sp. M4B.F.Ca.ET.215.01.1.1]TGQ36274.1 carbohydrate kinase [Mesorhizobium sp. M4B.F.Ca.ET.214.01.1.1]
MADQAAYLLGLDAGNTIIKAVLFDLAGRQVAMHTVAGRSHTPQPGYVERDLGDMWAAARDAIRRCIAQAGIDARQIAAVGCAGHGNGLYLIDRAGAPLIGIQSLDTRAAGMAAELASRNAGALHAICLQKPWPAQTPTLLAWVKQHEPDLYAATGTALLCKDFIAFCLTGEQVSDVSDMSGCGLVRMPEGVYDAELLALYGIEDAQAKLPRLLDSADIAGTVTASAAEETGLAEGTPVIAGYFDVVASAMGAGVVRPGEASIIAGTWSVNQVFSTAPVVDPDVFMVARFGPGRFVNIESSATSAANLEWYVREFVERGSHLGDPFGHCNAAVGEVTPAWDDPIFHPFLYGSGQSAEFRAGFYGLAGWHSEGHLLRALFEGVMFEHRRHIDVLKDAGVGFDKAVLSGGGSRSEHWPQIFADGLGVPITVPEARETGALGAAIGAGVAIGLFADYESGVDAMTRPRAAYRPDPAMQRHYARRYRAYCGLADTLRSFWTEQAAGPGRAAE